MLKQLYYTELLHQLFKRSFSKQFGEKLHNLVYIMTGEDPLNYLLYSNVI